MAYRRVRRPIIAFAPRAATTKWITEELEGEDCKVVFVPSIAMLVSRLAERSDQIAIVDFEAIDDKDIAAIAEVRHLSWKGPLVSIGRVEWEVRSLLRVFDFLARPLGSERLRKLITGLTSGAPDVLPRDEDEASSETMPFR